MTPQQQERLRNLPAVGALLEEDRVQRWIEQTSRPAVVSALQDALDGLRHQIVADGAEIAHGSDAVLAAAQRLLQSRVAPSLVRVVNATGIVLHTGLGRARLSSAATAAISEAARAYCNLEYDLATGRRGKRQRHVADLLSRLTGAEAATVVNNNAAATLLILATLAAGREVIVSRGQLVEIGGSFRLPEIMKASGAVLREVGTTNRTRIDDYAAAITDRTAVLMRVHTSNYRIVGFTEQASMAQIAELAHRFGLAAVDDLGSGALFDLTGAGLPHEPVLGESLAAGADVVCCSGDKLLGGPQCGIICGRRDLIERIEAHPLMRTYRVGKLTLSGLEATLRQYDDPAQAIRTIPALAMLAAGGDLLPERAEALQRKLAAALPDESFLVCSDVSYAGGGSLPAEALETVVVQWRPATQGIDAVTAAMRTTQPPVIVRVRDDAIVFDLRTVSEEEFDAVVAAALAAVGDSSRA
jgi:L-seryl-tRNA(Ser) seleniumtransferase